MDQDENKARVDADAKYFKKALKAGLAAVHCRKFSVFNFGENNLRTLVFGGSAFGKSSVVLTADPSVKADENFVLAQIGAAVQLPIEVAKALCITLYRECGFTEEEFKTLLSAPPTTVTQGGTD